MEPTGRPGLLPTTPLALLTAALLLGLAACGGSSTEEQKRATEEALATTDAEADTARTDTARTDTARTDTADTTGTWTRADTAAGPSDTTATPGSSPSQTGELTYKTYQNDKLGFSVRYPSSVLKPAGNVGNGNGRTFEAPDGSASMLVYATNEATSEKLKQRFKEQTTNPDLDITYQTRGDGWYVLSGYRGDHIFYERVEARDNTLKVVRMFYDRSQKARFDPIVREISSSLSG